MTLDGFCDHTTLIADDEMQNITISYCGALAPLSTDGYQPMESYWPTVVKNPTDNKPIDEFAVLIENIPKIVFSHARQNVGWKNATLANDAVKEEGLALKQQPDKDILVGSRNLIVTLMKLDLVDPTQRAAHCSWRRFAVIHQHKRQT